MPSARPRVVYVRLSEADRTLVERAARADDRSLGEWSRRALVRAASAALGGSAELPPATGSFDVFAVQDRR